MALSQGVFQTQNSATAADANAKPDATKDLTPEQQAAKDLVKKIAALENTLAETTTNGLGKQIPRIDDPNKVVKIIDDLEKILNDAKAKSGGKSGGFLGVGAKTTAPGADAFYRPEAARRLILNALSLLYSGRGVTTAPKDGTGWYPAARAPLASGLDQIDNILQRGLLDAEGKTMFEKFVESHHALDDTARGAKNIRSGFPPNFNLADNATKSRVLASAQSAPTGEAFQAMPEMPNLVKNLGEIVKDLKDKNGNPDTIAPELYKDLMGIVEKNHHDQSVQTLNLDSDFIDYYGREQEQHEFVDIISKRQKQHIILKGPAGVGKTTLMKQLQDKFVKGELSIREEEAPIFMELPITSVTNPSDPSQIKGIVAKAAELSKRTNRRIILFIDEAHVATKMTQNALKSFLTDATTAAEGHAKVHIVFATTSQEAQAFLEDQAFSRRFDTIHLDAFNREETIQLVKQSILPSWKKEHKMKGWSVGDISPEAYEYAYNYRKTEQPHSETGTQEMLERVITRKMYRDTNPKFTKPPKTGAVTITVDDVREYLKERHKIKLMPGDPNFESTFRDMWKSFDENYVGNDGAKDDLHKVLHAHFANPEKNNLTTKHQFYSFERSNIL